MFLARVEERLDEIAQGQESWPDVIRAFYDPFMKDLKQAQVDVMNAVVALRQARARYDAAVQNRILAQQLFDAERKKFTLGSSTPYNVVQQQRDLATAQSTEIAAQAAYSNARVLLDQTLGTTLEANHISLAEARAGKVAQSSSLPGER